MPHIHEKIDYAVSPIVIHPKKDKILLVNHPRYGSWMSIGGHIELDENPDQALLREIKEECGLEVEVLSERLEMETEGVQGLWRPRFLDIHDANSPHRHIGMVYFCQAKSDNFVLSAEHTDMRWFSLEDLDDPKYNVSGATNKYAKIALQEVNNL